MESFNGLRLFSCVFLPGLLSWPFVLSVVFNVELTIFKVGVALCLTWFVGGGVEFFGDSASLSFKPLVRGGDLADLGELTFGGTFTTLEAGLVAGVGECLGETLCWALMSALCAILMPRVWHTLLDSLSYLSGSRPPWIVSTPTFWGSICNKSTSCCSSQVAEGDSCKEMWLKIPNTLSLLRLPSWSRCRETRGAAAQSPSWHRAWWWWWRACRRWPRPARGRGRARQRPARCGAPPASRRRRGSSRPWRGRSPCTAWRWRPGSCGGPGRWPRGPPWSWPLLLNTRYAQQQIIWKKSTLQKYLSHFTHWGWGNYFITSVKTDFCREDRWNCCSYWTICTSRQSGTSSCRFCRLILEADGWNHEECKNRYNTPEIDSLLW